MNPRPSNIAAVLLLFAGSGGCNSRVLEERVGEDAVVGEGVGDDSAQDPSDQGELVTLDGYLNISVSDDFERGRSGWVYGLCTGTHFENCYELIFSSEPGGWVSGPARVTGFLHSSNNTITLSPDDVTLLAD